MQNDWIDNIIAVHVKYYSSAMVQQTPPCFNCDIPETANHQKRLVPAQNDYSTKPMSLTGFKIYWIFHFKAASTRYNLTSKFKCVDSRAGTVREEYYASDHLRILRLCYLNTNHDHHCCLLPRTTWTTIPKTFTTHLHKIHSFITQNHKFAI